MRFSTSRGRRLHRVAANSIGAAAALSLMLSACSGNTDAASDDSLTIMVSQSVFSSTIQVAEDQGFFADENVETEIVSSVSGAGTVTALTAGAVDIGAPPPSLVIPAINLGAPIKVMMNAYDFDVVLVAKPGILDSKSTYPENMKQLKGLRVGVAARGGAFEQTVQGSLEAAGMDPDKDVAFVAIGVGPSAVEAFQKDQVDVATFDATGAVLLEEGTYEVVATPEELVTTALSPEYMYSAWSTSSHTINDKPEAVNGFCRAMKRAADFILDPANKDTVVDSIAEWTGTDPEVASDVYDAYAKNFDTSVDEQRWDGQAQFVDDKTIPAFEDATLASCAELANS